MKMHQVTVLGEPMVQACEREFGSFCRPCEAEESEELPFRPSVGEPAGWSSLTCEEV